MKTEHMEKTFLEYIKNNNGIISTLGKLEFTCKDRIGEGGNGIVYLAKINEKDVAVKFLISDSERKKIRFKSEYFNTNYVKNELNNIVNMIHYDELTIRNEVVIPYIIMSRYSKNLKQFRGEKIKVEESEFEKIVDFLLATLESIHIKGIIHRDIKPENILVDEKGKFVLADFGIAHYAKDDFPINNKTRKGERLANIEFSAPEQINNQYEVTQTADIYSMAQIMYWYVFGIVNRGTGSRYIAHEYDWKYAHIYDLIIEKCLRNNPTERFESISEIKSFYKKEKNKKKEIDPFEDMYLFHNSILSVVPEFYNHAFCISNKEIIQQLIHSIFDKEYNRDLEFNTGVINNTIHSFIKLENNDYLINQRQFNIKCIWGLLTDNVYDDILLLEMGESSPYIIEGKEYRCVAMINNEDIIPYCDIESGYVRYKGKVHEISEMTIQERYVGNDYSVIAVAPFHSCSIIMENEGFLRELQNMESLKQADIYELNKKIRRNKKDDILMWL